MTSKDDYDLWKTWWYAAMYGAGSAKRMQMLDDKRRSNELQLQTRSGRVHRWRSYLLSIARRWNVLYKAMRK